MAKQSRKPIIETPAMTPITAERRQRMIEKAAYYRAAHRAFRDGNALADWLEAEAEIDHLLELLLSERQKQAAAKPAFQERLEAQQREFDTRFDDPADRGQETGNRSRQTRKAARSAR